MNTGSAPTPSVFEWRKHAVNFRPNYTGKRIYRVNGLVDAHSHCNIDFASKSAAQAYNERCAALIARDKQ